MARFPYILLLVYFPLLAFGQSGYNENYCKSFPPAAEGMIEFENIFAYKNVQFVSEIESSTTQTELWSYSGDLQIMATAGLYGPDEYIHYTDASHDQETFFSSNSNRPSCYTDLAAEREYQHSVYQIRTNLGNITRLQSLEELLQWDSSKTLSVRERRFIGYSKVRGIQCAVWLTCDYAYLGKETFVDKWYFSDSRYLEMPAGKVGSLLRKERHYQQSNYSRTYDYSMFREIPQNNLVTYMERPDLLVCRTNRLWISLPKMPTYFSLGGENLHTSLSSSVRQYLFGFQETYDFDNQLFVVTSVRSSGEGEFDEEAAVTVVNDFNTGVSYVLNANLNECKIFGSIHERISEIGVAGGFVKMRTPKQFFDFDSDKYEYTGVHMVRDFECDAWTVRFNDGQIDHDQNTTRIWYFMTQNQMRKLQYPENAPPKPMRLLVVDNYSSRLYDMFQFRTQRQTNPSVDLCYQYDPPETVRLTFQGNLENEVRQKGANNFKRAFVRDIQRYAHLGTPLRISDIDTFSSLTNSNEFYVQFRLFRRLPAGINVKLDKDILETDEALKVLQKQLDSSKVIVGVVYSPYDTIYLQAKPGSLMVSDNYGMFYKYGSSHNVTRTTNTNKETSGNKGSSGYSSGSMAGIGIGMIIIGFILGAGGVYLFKRFRGTGVANNFRMSDVRKNTDA